MGDCSRAVTPLIKYSHQPCSNSLLSSGNTKKAMTYEPRTEAISPAIGEELDISTKDEQTQLVEKLKKVEAEILQTDLQIARLRKQKAQLEQSNSSAKEDDDQENVCDTKQLSIAKLVYHENRSKAQKAHARLETYGGSIKDLPLYNQPSDNAVYHINAAKFANSFKKSLIAYFKERLKLRLKLEESVSEEYDRRMEKWLRQIEQEDLQPTKRMRDAKTREFFEKQFPELKKARESGERFSRVGQRVARSDAELDEILDGITEREDQDKKVKSYAVIPPMLEDMRSKKPKYINTNGYVEDIISEYKGYQILNTWTDEEKEIFRDNYLQNPKNFGLIATVTTRKNVANCVQYYYMSKKSENYKQLLKRQQKRRTRSFVRPTQQAPPPTTSELNDSTKTNGVKVANELASGDPAEQTSSEQTDTSKSTGVEDIARTKTPDQSNESEQVKSGPLKRDDATCCICDCEFSETNQSRNVTRSNHQLYGIGVEALKPGMRICYSCRFRHVRHSSFDEAPISPESIHQEENSVEPIEIDPPVISNPEPDIPSIPINQPKHPIEPPPAVSYESKAYQRTCVRDIIYQAIEMSFKPKSDSQDNHVKNESVQPETAQLNQLVAQHSMSNMAPIKTLAPNQTILPPISSIRSPLPSLPGVGMDHSQINYQIQANNKHRQMKIDFNSRQPFIPQQLQQPPLQPHLHPPPQLQIPQQPQLQLPHQLPQQQQLQHPQSQIPLPKHSQQPQQVQHQVLHQMPQLPQLPNAPLSQIPTTMTQANSNAPHPLNLCRKFSDVPVIRPQLSNSTRWTKPPPLAHGVKWMAPRAIMENGVLNLSKPSPPAPNYPPSQPHLVRPLSHPVPKDEPSEDTQDRIIPNVVPMTNKHPPESSPKEEPRSPNLTGSPASPCPMVIDETADVRSSPS